MRPHKQWHAEPGHAWAAHLVNGDDKVETGEDGAETGDEYRQACGQDVGIDEVRRQWRGECPACIHTARGHGVDGQRSPATYRYQLNRLILGSARSLAPSISG